VSIGVTKALALQTSMHIQSRLANHGAGGRITEEHALMVGEPARLDGGEWRIALQRERADDTGNKPNATDNSRQIRHRVCLPVHNPLHLWSEHLGLLCDGEQV
jgi:hypothetical protein